MTLRRVFPVLFGLGVALMLPFQSPVTLTLGVAFMIAAIVVGLFAVATPEYLGRKDD
jgi:F0F1-type ATP synthase membrane subunit c/vacuolar-type H+-ATPase subunit K